MESLVERAGGVGVTPVRLTARLTIPVRTLRVAFGRATPDRLKPGVLPATYTSKPLVSVGGDAMFGELALVRTLERDGWEGVWVDTFHGRRFWRGMPHRSAPVSLPPAARARYDAVVAANGGRASGFFDVLAWRGGQFVHLEYEGAGDRANRNALRWMAAALDAGVTPGELWIVRHPDARARAFGDPAGGA
jgi:hypothetical protein